MISLHFLPWELEGITSPCCLLIGQYSNRMTLCPPVAIVKRCYGIYLYEMDHILAETGVRERKKWSICFSKAKTFLKQRL